MRKRLALASLLLAATARGQSAPPPAAPPATPMSPSTPTVPPTPPLDAAGLARRVDVLATQLGAAQTRLDRQETELRRLKEGLTTASEPPATFHLGRFAVSLFGFVQADAVAYDQSSVDEVNPSTRQPLNATRFLIRRARLRVEAEYRFLGAVLEFDGNTVNGPVTRIVNAEVSACWPRCGKDRPPLVMATLGLMRIPFGFEEQWKDYVRLFLERSNGMRALFPGEFDLGARVQGDWRWLRWQVAVMNGHPAADKQFALVDPTASKDLLGRVGAHGQPREWLRLSGGLSALYGTGFSVGVPASKDLLVWHDANGDGQVDITELQGLPGQPALPSKTFDRYAFGGDVRLEVTLPRVGALTLYGELVWATNLDRGLYVADPVAQGRDLREFTWYLALTQELTRYASVGVRYDRYDPDQDAREQIGQKLVPRDKSVATLSVVAAAVYPELGRLSLEWDHNTNALARGASGAPATLGGEVVTLRAQVQF